MFCTEIYRYNPERDSQPWMQQFDVPDDYRKGMVLDALEYLKTVDSSLSFRRSCREGVCGSDGMNINGKNGLACITPVADKLDGDRLIIRPLSGMEVIRDLVVDQAHFFAQYASIQPWLINDSPPPTTHHRIPPVPGGACQARRPV